MKSLDVGQISLRMYPHPVPVRESVAEMLAQAVLAERVGFDGLMTSEHHGGFPGYIPHPLSLAGWLLDVTSHVWAGPCPLLLPLRHWSHVAEDLAWLAARFPGRVAAGFAAGGLAQDFEMADLDFAEARGLYKEALPRVVGALRGEAEGPLAADPAIEACRAAPIPLLGAVQGPVGARRAAKLGLGTLYDSMQTIERMREVSDAYRDAGGRGPRIAIRRVWVGPPPKDQVEAQMDFYRGYASQTAQAHWGQGQELVHGADGAEVAEKLMQISSEGGCDAFNLRLHVKGVSPEAVRDQIERLGAETLPLLRKEWKPHTA